MPPRGIRTHSPCKRAVADPYLKNYLTEFLNACHKYPYINRTNFTTILTSIARQIGTQPWPNDMYLISNMSVITEVLGPIHTYHAVPLPCRSAKGLDCVFPIWFTQWGRVWFTHTMPFPCHARNVFLKATSQCHGRVVAGSRQGDGVGTAWERHGMCKLASVVQWRHVSDLPAFGFFLLPRGVPGSLLSEAYQSQMQVASVKQSNVCHVRG
jgi:hypothetical protein